MAPRGYGFFSCIGKGIPEGRLKSQNYHSDAPISIGASESHRQIVHSLNGWMPFTDKCTPKDSYSANLIIRTGITHWGSTARRRTRCSAAIMFYLPQVRLAYAESLSREASPSLAIATRAAPATAHPFGGEQSARFAELCTVARKVLPQIQPRNPGFAGALNGG